ncbi:MAG: hypothetical protein SO067_01380 [Bacilli bacterium]|jgi:hypothetical protein|nr:hypothetical protein [Bacilli bacterium]
MVPFKDIDMDDFISIMKIYVVVKVVNLDGSNSSVLVKNSKMLNEQRDRRIDLCCIFL